MKPILYESTETAFDTNGLGVLADAARCLVTEERNGSFELELDYPVAGIHYGSLALRALILAAPNPADDPQPFRVYRISRPMDGLVTVYAQHLSYDLAGIPAAPFTAISAPAAMAALKTAAAVDCPFEFWTDKETAATMTVAAPASIRSLLGGSQGSILDTYGGEYAFDRYTVRLYGRRGADRGVSIRYGKNLTSLQQEENCAAVYTGAYPFWTGQDGALVQLPEKVLPAPGSYDFTRILALDLSQEWQDPPTAEQLRTRAQRYMRENEIGTPKVSLEVEFAQLEQTEEYKDLALLERVELGDTVSVEFAALGVSASARVVKTVYDPLRGRYDSIELGDARANIADTIAAQQQAIKEAPSKSYLQQAVAGATAQITGNLGGYVVLHSSTGGPQPDEILIMDQPSIEAAVKVWRWNKAGLGYSSSGYNGPYGLAMTADGQIVADFITTGVLNANLIKAGAMTSVDGDVSFDLEKAQISMRDKRDGGNIDVLGILSNASFRIFTDYGHPGTDTLAVSLATIQNSKGGGLSLYQDGIYEVQLTAENFGGRLQIGDADGNIRLYAGMRSDGKPQLFMRDSNGKTRLTIGFLDGDRPFVSLYNSSGSPTLQIYENEQGKGILYQN